MSLKGRTALVTGSTSGIGLGIADGLAAAGANVMLNGLGTAAEIEAAQKQVARHGTRIAYDGANMLKPAEIAGMVAKAESDLGCLDILVNNAGIQHVAPVDEFPIDKWDAIIAINLTSAFHTVRAALPAMKRRKFGRIINICSAHSLVASPFKSAYIAAKHGLAGFTKTVALEVATSGVTVNAISPGFVLTPLVEKQLPDLAKAKGLTVEEVKQQLLVPQPIGRFVRIEELAALAVFLSGEAAGAITGANYSVDGGWTAQ